MYNYTYIVRAINFVTGEIVQQWHACARPLTALRRFKRNVLFYLRENDGDEIVVTVFDKEGNICFEGNV